MTPTAHRHNPLVAARAQVAAAHWDPNTGQPHAPNRWTTTTAALNGVFLALTPGTTYYTHNSAYARLTHLATALAALTTSIAVLAPAAVLVAITDTTTHKIGYILLACVAAITAVLSAEPLRRARRISTTLGAYLLSDLTRHPTSTPGSGSALLDHLRSHGHDIIATTNQALYTKLYQPRSELLHTDPDGRHHLRLKQT